MSYEANSERQSVLAQVLRATTPEEIDTAKVLLRAWVDKHPDDLGIVDAFEQLEIMREARSGNELPA